jgi:hypothetical protein
MARSFIVTRKAREKLYSLWQRSSGGMTYRQFRRTCYLDSWGTLIVPRWAGMTIGILEDGSSHS